MRCSIERRRIRNCMKRAFVWDLYHAGCGRFSAAASADSEGVATLGPAAFVKRAQDGTAACTWREERRQGSVLRVPRDHVQRDQASRAVCKRNFSLHPGAAPFIPKKKHFEEPHAKPAPRSSTYLRPLRCCVLCSGITRLRRQLLTSRGARPEICAEAQYLANMHQVLHLTKAQTHAQHSQP